MCIRVSVSGLEAKRLGQKAESGERQLSTDLFSTVKVESVVTRQNFGTEQRSPPDEVYNEPLMPQAHEDSAPHDPTVDGVRAVGAPDVPPDGGMASAGGPLPLGKVAEWDVVLLARAYSHVGPASGLELGVRQYTTPFGLWTIDRLTPPIQATQPSRTFALGLHPERKTGLELVHSSSSGSLGPWAVHLTPSDSHGRVTRLCIRVSVTGPELRTATDLNAVLRKLQLSSDVISSGRPEGGLTLQALDAAQRRRLDEVYMVLLLRPRKEHSELYDLTVGNLAAVGAPSAPQDVVVASTRERTELGNEVKWEVVPLAQAYFRWAPKSGVELRLGQYMTPFGVWNIDRLTSAFQPIEPPLTLAAGLLPERQLGLEVVRSWSAASLGIWEVHLTLSDAEGPLGKYRDLERKRAYGARAQWSRRASGEWTAGVAVHHAHNPRRAQKLALLGHAAETEALGCAADLSWSNGALLVQSEVVAQQRRFRATRISRTGETSLTFARSDALSWTAYGLLGYRLRWLGLMPYVLFEGYGFNDTGAGETILTGLNVRADEWTELALEYANDLPLAREIADSKPPDQRLQLQLTLDF